MRAGQRRARGIEHRRNLGRMVTVVVDHRDAVHHAPPFETPLGALELGQRLRDHLEGRAQFQAHGHGRERVQHRMASRHLQPQAPERHRLGAAVARIAPHHVLVLPNPSSVRSVAAISTSDASMA